MSMLKDIEERLIEIANRECPDYPNIETADTFTRLWAIEQTLEGRAGACDDLHKEIKKRDELLKAAKCPSCNGGGVHLDIDSEYIKCQWCDEVNKLKGEG